MLIKVAGYMVILVEICVDCSVFSFEVRSGVSGLSALTIMIYYVQCAMNNIL